MFVIWFSLVVLVYCLFGNLFFVRLICLVFGCSCFDAAGLFGSLFVDCFVWCFDIRLLALCACCFMWV